MVGRFDTRRGKIERDLNSQKKNIWSFCVREQNDLFIGSFSLIASEVAFTRK